jgi:TonB-dependent starch-binding outer membrane protein SusC
LLNVWLKDNQCLHFSYVSLVDTMQKETHYTPNGDFQSFIGADPNAKVTAGLTNSFKFGNFDASIFFNGVFGNYIYSNTANAYFTKGSLANGRNVTADVVATKEGPFNAPDVSTRFSRERRFC